MHDVLETLYHALSDTRQHHLRDTKGTPSISQTTTSSTQYTLPYFSDITHEQASDP